MKHFSSNQKQTKIHVLKKIKIFSYIMMSVYFILRKWKLKMKLFSSNQKQIKIHDFKKFKILSI